MLQRVREKWQGVGLVATQAKGTTNLNAIDEDDSENVKEATDSEEDLQAWCSSEESEHEQWQEVIS